MDSSPPRHPPTSPMSTYSSPPARRRYPESVSEQSTDGSSRDAMSVVESSFVGSPPLRRQHAGSVGAFSRDGNQTDPMSVVSDERGIGLNDERK
jgi:hypothetical protein